MRLITFFLSFWSFVGFFAQADNQPVRLLFAGSSSTFHNKIKVFVPCSSAWARASRERPNLDLQHPNDRSHPGDIGHFINLACFKDTISNLP